MTDETAHCDAGRRLHYPDGVPIRYLDHEFPDGSFVADGERLVEWNDAVCGQLAIEAMLLAQGAQRAREMLDAAARHEPEPRAPQDA